MAASFGDGHVGVEMVCNGRVILVIPISAKLEWIRETKETGETLDNFCNWL